MSSFVSRYFLQNLKFLKKLHGYKNVTLAKELGVVKSSISNYLAGKKPDGEIVQKIANLFGYTLTDLLDKNLMLEHVQSTGSTTLGEGASKVTGGKVFDELPLFKDKIQMVNDNIYRPENFESWFYFPMTIYEKEECYAVRVTDDDMIKKIGILPDSIIIYARDRKIDEKGVAAVFLTEENRIAIRYVHETKTQISLSSDAGKKNYKKSQEPPFIILGKIVKIISSLNIPD